MKKQRTPSPLLFVGIGVLALVIVSGVVGAKLLTKSSPQVTQTEKTKKKVSKPVNTIGMDERPYVLVSPTMNREIDVTVLTLPKKADEVEYLAEYQYGTSLGGNENVIPLSTLPAKRQFALYSRSAGGKTSYEEDVKGGSVTLKFLGSEEYWLKQEWNYYDLINPKSSTKESAITSRDGKFSISGDPLKSLKYVIVYNSPGYPQKPDTAALSEVYTFQYAGNPASGELSVTIRMNSESAGTIVGWDGTSYTPFETTVTGKEATAMVKPMQAYMVVGK